MTTLEKAVREPQSNVTYDSAIRSEHKFFCNPAANLSTFVPINLFGEYRETSRLLSTNIHRFVSSSTLSGVTYFHGSIGALVGSENKRPVCLPVLSDVVVSNEDISSSTLIFDPRLKEVDRSALISYVLQTISSRLIAIDPHRRLTLTVSDDEQYIVEYYPDNLEVWKNAADASVIKYVKREALEVLVVYRADRNMHIQLVSESVTPMTAYTITSAAPLMIESRKVDVYKFVEGKGPLEWELSLHESKIRGEEAEEEADGTFGGVKFGFSKAFWDLIVTANESAVTTNQRAEFETLIKTLSGLFISNCRWLAAFNDDLTNDLLPTLQYESYPTKFYYPNAFGDIVAKTRQHYNLKKIGAASASAIEIVRKTNNHAKRLLIDQYVPLGSSVLDLACGHGQDLLKYAEKKVNLFVGIDVSQAEIIEARDRAKRPQNRSRFRECRFHVGNILKPESYGRHLIKNPVVDVVSVQLAIHYTLGSESNARLVLSSIADRLKPGGVLIGSCPSSFVIAERINDSLKRRIKDSGQVEYVFGNNVYKVKFDETDFTSIRGCPPTSSTEIELPGNPTLPPHPWIEDMTLNMPSPRTVPLGFGDQRDSEINHYIDSNPLRFILSERWSLKYDFWLVDHINATEFIVPWRAFCRLAASFGLQCLFAAPFDQFCETKLRMEHPVAKDFENHIAKAMENSITKDDQKEVIHFYHVFAFRKVETPKTVQQHIDNPVIDPVSIPDLTWPSPTLDPMDIYDDMLTGGVGAGSFVAKKQKLSS